MHYGKIYAELGRVRKSHMQRLRALVFNVGVSNDTLNLQYNNDVTNVIYAWLAARYGI